MGPTQEDVAKRAKVSRALVSLVMRGSPNVSETRKRRVLRAAEELGYRPNAYARSLASKSNHTIGVLINDVTNPYFGGVYSSLAAAADQAGFDLLVAPGTRSAVKETALVHTLLEHRVAGLALLSPLMSAADLRRHTSSWPTVIVGRGATIPGVDIVTTDEREAARSVVQHLVALGHSDILHVTGGSRRAARDRSRAYRQAMDEAGLAPREVPGAFTHEGGQRAGREILAMRALPTAVFACNDLVAVGVMGVLEGAGVAVPDDVSVVGFDDSQIAQLEQVQLTSVRQPVESFGTEAIELLLDRIDRPDAPRVVRELAPELVERRTTRRAGRARTRTS